MKKVTKKQAQTMLKEEKILNDLFAEGYTILMPEAKAKNWLNALRDGTFIQAEGTLHNPKTGGFCCLGVEQYVNNNGNVECYDHDEMEFRQLPSITYLRENKYLFVDAINGNRGNPNILNQGSVAYYNDQMKAKFGANQFGKHKFYVHENDFNKMADLLEKIMLVY